MSVIYDKVVEILVSLGINETFYFQLVIFCIAYFGMSQIVFKPYLRAYEERKKRTVGSEKDAEDMILAAEQKEALYSEEAKALNSKIKDIYKEKADAAVKDRSQILESARSSAEGQLKEGRDSLEKVMDETRSIMKEHIPAISQKIEEKFSG